MQGLDHKDDFWVADFRTGQLRFLFDPSRHSLCANPDEPILGVHSLMHNFAGKSADFGNFRHLSVLRRRRNDRLW